MTVFNFRAIPRMSLITAFIYGALFTLSARAEVCKIEDAETLLAKVKTHHPALLVEEKRKNIALAEIDKASQRPNPVVNLGANYGSFDGTKTAEGSLNFQYVLELGDKRDSRMAVAQSAKKLSDFQVETQKQLILMDSTLAIYRLTQIQTLLELYQESIEVFKKTRNSLRKNKSLSPEQKVQEDILDIEVGKHRLKISALRAEQQKLESLLNYYSGSSCRLDLKPFQFEFPQPTTFATKSLILPQTRELQIQTELHQSKLDLATSEAFPDLKLGPSFQWEEERGQRIERYGIALSMDLPLLHRNEGGRAVAQATLDAKQTRLSYFQAKNQALAHSKLSSYTQVLASLKASPSRQELLRKHHRIEGYFTRGLISVSTMLEGHDQLLGLIEERDENELLALKTLLELNQATGELDNILTSWGQK